MTIYETEKCLSAMQKSHITVKANSIRKIEEEEACENRGECKCFSCEYREGGHGGDCLGRCDGCEDEPLDECPCFKYADW